MNVYLLNLAIVILASDLLKKKILKTYFLYILGIFLILFLGLRHEIGADWGGYSIDYSVFEVKPLSQIGSEIFNNDILYLLLNYLSIYLKADIHLLNFIISFIFIISFFKWVENEKNIDIYLVLFFALYFLPLGIGYIRQGLAISFFVLALNYWKNENKLYILFLVFSFLSHKFAIIYFFILFLNPKKRLVNFTNFFSIFFISTVSLIFVFIFLNIQVPDHKNLIVILKDYFVRYKDLNSTSATFRLGIGFISSILFFQHLNYFKGRQDFRFLATASFINIFLFVIHFKFSTISDRFGLYMIPFNLIILSNFIDNYEKNMKKIYKSALYLISILYFVFVTNYSPQKHLIIPYNTIDPYTYKSYKIRMYLERMNFFPSGRSGLHVPNNIVNFETREFYILSIRNNE